MLAVGRYRQPVETAFDAHGAQGRPGGGVDDTEPATVRADDIELCPVRGDDDAVGARYSKGSHSKGSKRRGIDGKELPVGVVVFASDEIEGCLVWR